MSGPERVTIELDGQCGNCKTLIPRAYSYCPFCGAHWTVLEPTMTTVPLAEAFRPPRPPSS